MNLLPHDLDAERALLAAVMVRGRLEPEARDLHPSAFYGDLHRRAWAAVEALDARGEPVDLVTLNAEMKARGTIEAGEVAKLAALLDGAVRSANVSAYADLVRDASVKRRIVKAAAELGEHARNGTPPVALAAMLRTIADDCDRQPETNAGPRALDLADCLTETPEPIPWALPQRLARLDVATLGGDPKLGKSLLALSMNLCAASGRPWLGMIPIEGERLRCLYVDEEQSERLIRYRVRRLAHGLGIKAAELASLPIRYLFGNGLRLDRPEGRERLFRAVEDHEAELVTLDSLVRFHELDENSAGDMSALYGSAILPLSRQYGAAVLGLHHLSKPHRDASPDLAHRLRGSGDLVAAVDQLWTLERGDGGRITLRHERSRWGETAAPLDVQIRDTEDGLGVIVTAAAVSNVAEDAILAALRDAGSSGALRADLVEAVEATGLQAARRAATRAIGRLHGERRVGKAPEGKAVRYWLAEHAPARLLDQREEADS